MHRKMLQQGKTIGSKKKRENLKPTQWRYIMGMLQSTRGRRLSCHKRSNGNQINVYGLGSQ